MKQPDPSQLRAYRALEYVLIPLHKWDAESILKTGKPRKDGKRPLDNRWTTADYSDFDYEEYMAAGGNIGVRLRETDLIIDVDPRNGGTESFVKLQRDLGVCLDDAPTVITGGGGLHIYFHKPANKLVVGSLPDYPGVEFKTRGQQVVASGSIHPDAKKPYKWDPLNVELDTVVKASSKLLLFIARPAPAAKASRSFEIYDQEEVAQMLDSMEPGDFRDEQEWRNLMMSCHHASGGLARHEFIEWSTRDPEYSDHDWIIGRRWDSCDADKAGGITYKTLLDFVRTRGKASSIPVASAQDDFDKEPDKMDRDPDLPEHEQRDPFETLSEKYHLVCDGTRFRIFYKRVDPLGILNHIWYGMARTDFQDWLAHRRIKRKGSDKVVQLAKAWIESPETERFRGVIFDPECERDGFLNVWTGFQTEPRKGEWPYMRELIEEVLCDGNEEVGEYVIKWLAYMVQKPWLPAETCIAFHGKPGTGKSTLGEYLIRMIGQHSLHVSSSSMFMGRFNGHLRDQIFLFADEAVNPLDKGEHNRLKALITERQVSYESKGKDIVPARNMLHIMMASNDDLIAPMGMDERRFLTCEVSDVRKGDQAFFGRLRKQMDEEGGLAAMLWDLKAMDLGDWAPRAGVPHTASGLEQKLRMMDPVAQWWYDHLSTGEPFCEPWPDRNGDYECWIDGLGLKMYVPDVWDSFSRFCKRSGISPGSNGRNTKHGFTKAIKKVCPLYMTGAVIIVPEDRIVVKAYKDGSLRGVKVPTLAELRTDFERRINEKIEWDPIRYSML